ncbi:MAG: TIM barrel protein, partial [Butyricicoccaceae bacterium]
MSARFGPAGNSESFARAGFKATADAPRWLAEMGLDAYEYQCGRGVRIGSETAHKIGEQARLHGIVLSLHSPYFINLSSEETERVEKNADYVLQSCRAADDLGADRIVVHCGGMGKLTRARAMENTERNVLDLLERVENAGYGHIRLCLETMGKVRQMGSAEEVMQLVALDERLLPCIDFGHLNARTQGGLQTREQVAALF